MTTIAFTVNFAVWTIFSIIGVAIKKDLALSEFEFGLLVATTLSFFVLVRLRMLPPDGPSKWLLRSRAF